MRLASWGSYLCDCASSHLASRKTPRLTSPRTFSPAESRPPNLLAGSSCTAHAEQGGSHGQRHKSLPQLVRPGALRCGLRGLHRVHPVLPQEPAQALLHSSVLSVMSLSQPPSVLHQSLGSR